MSIILGCDPGSVRTGWAFIETQPLTYIDSGVIELGDREFWERIGVLKTSMLVLKLKYHADILVLEKAFVSLNKLTALKLAQIRGCLMGLCHEQGVQYAEYSPREIKRQITGYGAASKEQVALMIQRCLKMDPSLKRKFDESDAIAIALCHAYALSTSQRFAIQGRAL